LKTASGLGFGLGGLDLRLGLDKNQAKQNQIKRSNQSKKQWETKKKLSLIQTIKLTTSPNTKQDLRMCSSWKLK